jgi:lysozyme
VQGIDISTSQGTIDWTKWTIWQYGSQGKVNGIAANVDIDLFNGALDQLKAFAHSSHL